jgi:hypothetical protein
VTHLLHEVMSLREGNKQDCEDLMCAGERFMYPYLYTRISVNLESVCQ